MHADRTFSAKVEELLLLSVALVNVGLAGSPEKLESESAREPKDTALKSQADVAPACETVA